MMQQYKLNCCKVWDEMILLNWNEGGIDMFCPYCGSNIENESLFCKECGASLQQNVSNNNGYNQVPVEAQHHTTPIKKKKTGLLLAVIILVIAILATSVFFIVKSLSEDTDKPTNNKQITSTSNKKEEEEKWLLIEQRVESNIPFLCNMRYGYDEKGFLISQEYRYENFSSYFKDFKYDKNGNVVSMTEVTDENGKGTETYWYYEYTYDEKGNCLSEELSITYDYGDTFTILTAWEYDSEGFCCKEVGYTNGKCDYVSILAEKEKMDDNTIWFKWETTYNYSSEDAYTSYENEKHVYDKNDNLIERYEYNETTEDYLDTIVKDGKTYRLYRIVYYTYELVKKGS